MSDSRLRYKPIRLRAGNGHRQALIETPDGDRFVTTVAKVIESCKRMQQIEWAVGELQNLLTQLVERLVGWLRKHNDRVLRAFLTIRDANLLFLVVQKEVHKDEELCDNLVELDLEIAQDARLGFIPLSVLVLPPAGDDALAGFLNPVWTYEFDVSN